MAGNYMDAPSDRIAWDRDGSVAVLLRGGDTTLVPVSDRRLLNDEDETSISLTDQNIAVIFPIPMDLVSVFFAATLSRNDYTWRIETSKDTTNGLDGTWSTQFQTGFTADRNVKPDYRMADEQLTLQDNSPSSDLRGIRFMVTPATGSATTWTSTVKALHLYGVPAQTATKDRLAFWDPVLDVKLPPYYFDWGNVPRSTSADRVFRLKNLSTNRNATDIDLYAEALTPGNPTVDGMHTFSLDGVSFLTGLVLPALAPGEISPPITVRRTVPSNAQVSVWSARIAADVNLWEAA